MVIYKKFDIPAELVKESLNILEKAAKTGSVRKGTNEVTKAIERKTATMIFIAEDVEPPEIVMHLPLLCEENKIPYTFVPTRKDLGEAVGLPVGSASIAVTRPGEAKATLESLANKVDELKK